MLAGKGSVGTHLAEDEARDLVAEAFAQLDWNGERILLLIPDGTRTAPVGMMFRILHERLLPDVAALDVLIALGTHQPMSRQAILERLEVTEEEARGRFVDVQVFNHHWEDPGNFRTLGTIPATEVRELSRGLLAQDVPVAINKLVFDYDRILVCGPVFPHEVAGFSGGSKYFVPGISGREVIDFTHWLGALITCYEIIGTQQTPVRAVIDRAVDMIDVPRLYLNMVASDGGLAGLFIGSSGRAWAEAARLSSRVHIRLEDAPYHQVLSIMPGMYEDIWTAAKGMYKLEPVVADGGELIIYAPHITELSATHGEILDRIGYHVRDYFTAQWEDFRYEPWGVLAHSTHLKGLGTWIDGVESPRIRVTLATGIARERCERVHLGYRDPRDIRPEELAGREAEGTLVVPHAGEILYRLHEGGNLGEHLS